MDAAVHQSRALSVSGLMERAFTFAFRDLVYAQIWEDPVVDMEALDIQPDSRVVAIASGGCNVLSYLTANPAHVQGVDLNASHVALCRLKLAALTTLQNHETFYDFIGRADDPKNVAIFDKVLSPKIDVEARKYWNQRDGFGRRRISAFEKNIYRSGLLGRFIALAHFVARRNGVEPENLVSATTREDMQARFDLARNRANIR